MYNCSGSVWQKLNYLVMMEVLLLVLASILLLPMVCSIMNCGDVGGDENGNDMVVI